MFAVELKPEAYLGAVGRLLDDALNARAADPSSHYALSKVAP
jgi:hypothetical protein